MTQSLSLIFGTEALVVLKDIWGLEGDEARRVAIWAADALVRAATRRGFGDLAHRRTEEKRRGEEPAPFEEIAPSVTARPSQVRSVRFRERREGEGNAT